MKKTIKIYYNEEEHLHKGYAFIKKEESIGSVYVSQETYTKLHSRPANSNWVYKNNKIALEYFEIEQTSKEFDEERKDFILNWLFENDWKVNKVFLGEWDKSDPRFQNYLEKRERLRIELDEIERRT